MQRFGWARRYFLHYVAHSGHGVGAVRRQRHVVQERELR